MLLGSAGLSGSRVRLRVRCLISTRLQRRTGLAGPGRCCPSPGQGRTAPLRCRLSADRAPVPGEGRSPDHVPPDPIPYRHAPRAGTVTMSGAAGARPSR
ncbi:hypothetical protein STVIR_4321 [Streptomyces viridochromogenes Tue57]|uniref:Uncharacterized protein n=1 Tax=Streptomyces viridochromogenes Tue57 TaxID=1160705 RepID=L8PF58_STRVR|nr:hypothetical protein STVIR_4321 [Streptomyces viridochromogenes Tue57]